VRGRLLFELSTFAPDFVFSRQAFERVGGFQDFPLAWCSDDATWTKLAARHGIVNVAGPRVRWRLSGSNISSRSAANAQVKVEAQLQFVEWLCGALSSLPRLAGDPDDASLRQWARWWFFEQSQRVGAVFDARDALGMSRRLARADGGSLAGALLRTLRHRLCQPAAGAAPAPASGAGTGTR
jgi:hypothetical protein